MTYTTQNKVTHINTETGRELTVTQAFEEKFPGVAKHWVMGGEVEYKYNDGAWVNIFEESLREFVLDDDVGNSFRIKKRNPQPGEVWTNDGEPHIYGCAVRGSGGYGFIGLNGTSAYADSYSDQFEYAAPSVQAYYARELLSETAELTLDNVLLSCEEYNN